ncbi:hypothetical protein [Pseudarthrobacter sp. L1SW]|jgi:hypothetical protein|uniref:hypothetical protein n=1 Tax=Pseudarthrobacter sp. L1SW TaxID=2851598 RepID=UPI001E49871A|nr:hypothetical protein [Pseudarthrobacter sp. L1SW]UEL29439.1 hypothetical protein KTR40_04750 [Pseudarthrobacter sp. L1SW]
MPADIFTLHAAVTSRPEDRLECLYGQLTDKGLPDAEARTEVARIAAREVWDAFAVQLRHHRAAGHQMDASVLAVALGSLQGLTLPLLRHSGNVAYASRAVGTARRRLQYNGGLLHRLHPHNNPAFNDADAALEALEAFLAQSRPKAA